MALIEYTPQRILTTENMSTKSVVTSEHWNDIINLLTSQGNNSATAIYNMLNAIAATTGASQVGAATITGVTGTTVQAIMAGLKGLVDLCYTASATDSLLAQKETVADANQLVKSVAFNATNGVFTITTQGGTVSTIDTALEKVAVNFTYDQATQSLILTLADGSTQTIPLSSLIQENDFVDSSTIDFSVVDHTVTASIKSGSITEAMFTSATVTALIGYKNAAEQAAINATASESNALTYKNAAKVSQDAAKVSEDNAKISETNAKTSETNAKTSETNAKTSETNSATSAAESLQYRNEAESIVGQKVYSFNGRDGVVTPVSGDYTAEMVGAISATEKGAANGVATLGVDGKIPVAQSSVAPILTGTSAPISSTVGSVGQFYLNTVTKILYQCTVVNGSVCTWETVIPASLTTLASDAGVLSESKHYWTKQAFTVNKGANTVVTITHAYGSNAYSKMFDIQYSASVYVDASGKLVLENPSTVSVSYDAYTNATVLTGKYVIPQYYDGTTTTVSADIYYVSNSSPYQNSSFGYSVNASVAQLSTLGTTGTKSYVNSYTSNAYPTAGAVSGYSYSYKGNPIPSILSLFPNTAIGTYTGTGTCGSSAKNSLTLPFSPKFVYVGGREAAYALIMIKGGTQTSSNTPNTNANVYYSINDNIVQWYNNLSASLQLNDAVTYPYFAIG